MCDERLEYRTGLSTLIGAILYSPMSPDSIQMVMTIGFDTGSVNDEWYSSEDFYFVTQSAVCIMVWGCISIHKVGNLVVAESNLDAEGYISI